MSAAHHPHQRILASAGAGKTYQLAGRYLRLVAAGAEPPTMLAATFTRLAAGEIRDRMLMRLVEAVDDGGRREELAGTLGVSALSRVEVVALVSRLIRDIHRMQIRTLDGFFAAIVHAFGLELGVPPGCAIGDEVDAAVLRRRAIRSMLSERKPDELVELLRRLLQGSSERSVMRAIDQTVEELHALSRQTDRAAWACVPEPPGRLNPPQVDGLIERLADWPLAKPATHVRARDADVERAAIRDWEGFLQTGIAKRVTEGEADYYKAPIEPGLLELYRPLVAHAGAEYVHRVREQTVATRELLEMFGRAYEREKRGARLITFDDLVSLLQPSGATGSLDDIGYRIDASIEHVLLDEFQDTSVAQWQVLEPIVRELVCDETRGRTFFCVGDLKQSIYGWRDAEPEVLEKLPELLFGPGGEAFMEDVALSTSWRSAPVIMETVNRVFSSLTKNAALAEHGAVAESWQGSFHRHDTARTDLDGRVELRTVESDGDDAGGDAKTRRYRAAAAWIVRLQRRAPHRSIGVLVRTNHAVAWLLSELARARPAIAVSGRGGGPLTDAPAVNAVLDLLRLADHPQDTVSAFNVAAGPAGRLVGAGPRFHESGQAAARRTVAARVRRQLVQRGYAATIGQWVHELAGHCEARERRRLVQLVELAEQHDRRRTLRTDEFVGLVEARDVADVKPASVQVMTIHKSKGLEFDVVVLPELEVKLAGERSPNVVFERSGPAGPVTRVCRYIRKGLRHLTPELEPLFAAHEQHAVYESLCLLYVAMTRARQGLYMLIDPPGRPRATMATLLHAALAGGPVGKEDLVWADGDETWIDAPLAAPPPISAPPPVATPLGITASGARPGQWVSPASALDRPARLTGRLVLSDGTARDRGTVLHRLFERVEWIETFDAAPETLHAAARSVGVRRDEAWFDEQVSRFLTMLERPAVRDILSAAAVKGAAATVWREHPFARRVRGGLQTGSIDRLVAVYEDETGGTVKTAQVLDFKTGQIDAGAAVEQAAHFKPQLEAYREAAAAFLRCDVGRVGAVVVFVEPGVVVDVVGEVAMER